MKTITLAAAFVLISGAAMAQSCKIEAGAKHLAGAAQSSFMKKCEKDAAAKCDSQAMDKKLSGAAKTSFTKKCVRDAVGS
jgi:hypothetical protein